LLADNSPLSLNQNKNNILLHSTKKSKKEACLFWRWTKNETDPHFCLYISFVKQWQIL